ncbi:MULTISPECIES: tyrosine-protein phosphatase [Burkholderia cepacia complex]|uniref:Tyrosine-protein phosphatase n=1 Tax=Burkholderia stabilis TaxID=95485 RepID=A0AAJ5NFD0_9BURK|nr:MULTISPECIES: tyrosine-protein phosphatase [Burkholderia cepacia complex]MBR8290506.1 tyrosine-protein phosphatase [Burkholderia cenocepacia]ONU69319.1 hypothetical protein A8E62_05600 [Burkholderia cenocepacia]ONU94834.1 hypothetical protein A8E63_04765 [Burkholderia cenocepacia]VBB17439.1 hypothetical protein BSTAB16_7656 [Burkholderia stabilis]
MPLTQLHARNLRPLGRVARADSLLTVYRSAALCRLGNGELAALARAAGPLSYLDLRTAPEIAADPVDERLGATVLHRPLAVPGGVRWQGNYDVEHLLAAYAAYAGQAYAAVEAIAQWTTVAGPANLVVACSAGKDRTGVVALMLSRLTGVPAENAIRDFAASFPHVMPPACDPDSPYGRSFRSRRHEGPDEIAGRFLELAPPLPTETAAAFLAALGGAPWSWWDGASRSFRNGI